LLELLAKANHYEGIKYSQEEKINQYLQRLEIEE